MRRMPWTTYLWPGLPQIWLFGEWPGLGLALAAACVLDVLLVVSFGWSELIDRHWRIALWGAFAAAWVAAAAWSVGYCRRRAETCNLPSEQDSFGAAVEQYLKGNHYEAEQILGGLLRRNARDIEARLMLATLLRRVGRRDEAARHLDALEHFEAAAKWALEIEEERALLAEAKNVRSSADAKTVG